MFKQYYLLYIKRLFELNIQNNILRHLALISFVLFPVLKKCKLNVRTEFTNGHNRNNNIKFTKPNFVEKKAKWIENQLLVISNL